MYARLFLIYGGAVLLLLGIVGYLGVFNDQSSAFWLDSGENVAHTFLGIVALAAVFVPGLNTALRPYYRAIVALVGVLALFFANELLNELHHDEILLPDVWVECGPASTLVASDRAWSEPPTGGVGCLGVRNLCVDQPPCTASPLGGRAVSGAPLAA